MKTTRKQPLKRAPYISILIGSLVIGAILTPLMSYLSSLSSAGQSAALYIEKFISVFSLTLVAVGYGAAFTYASRGETARGLFYVHIMLCGVLIQLVSSFLVGLFDLTVDGAYDSLLVLLTTTVVNIPVCVALYYGVFTLCHFCFLRSSRGAAKGRVFLSLRSPLGKCALLATAVSVTFSLADKTVEVVRFVSSYSPLYSSEIISIVIDYIICVVAGMIFYAVTCITCEKVMRWLDSKN